MMLKSVLHYHFFKPIRFIFLSSFHPLIKLRNLLRPVPVIILSRFLEESHLNIISTNIYTVKHLQLIMSLEIKECDINFNEIVLNSDLNQDTKNKIMDSALVFLPNSFLNSNSKRQFAAETSDLYKYIKQTHPEIKSSFFENPGEEKTEILCSAYIVLPDIFIDLAKDIAIPIIVQILSSYVYDKLGGIIKPNDRVKTDIYYTDNDSKTMNIKYDGPMSGLKDIEKMINSGENKKNE